MISAVILTKNEEKNISDCISGLLWCDEILVVDDNSTDKTVLISKKLGVKVLRHSLDDDFSAQRNFALNEARHDWIFFVDADERVSPELKKEILDTIGSSFTRNVDGFYFKRIDNFEGKWLRHGEIGSIRILRLARRGSGIWKRRVDEFWQVKGKTSTFKNHLLHYAHSNLSDFLESINQRSTLNARQFYEEETKLNIFEWTKPFAKFFVNYFFRLGFLDGIAGFIFAVLMSLHSFLVRGKLYLLWKRGGGWK